MVLSAANVRSLTAPGRCTDEKGLHLWVRPDGRRSWVLRYRLGAKQKDMGLGGYPDVCLAAARQAAETARERLRAGEDPIIARKAERTALVQKTENAEQRSFQTLAERYIAKHEAIWKNPKHRQQWKNTLASYAYPRLGNLDVGLITRADVLTVLEPILARAPETASRLRGRIETVLDYAAARGLREAGNPARWRDLQHELPAPRKLQPVENQPAGPAMAQAAGVHGGAAGTSGHGGPGAQVFDPDRPRTSEVMGAIWREIDAEHAVWTIPAKRMKASSSWSAFLDPRAPSGNACRSENSGN